MTSNQIARILQEITAQRDQLTNVQLPEDIGAQRDILVEALNTVCRGVAIILTNRLNDND